MRIILTVVFIFSVYALSAQTSSKELLMRSYQQAVLSQQITKHYIAACLKINKRANIKKLQNDALTFSDELEELDVELLSIGMQDQMIDLREVWLAYRKVLFSGGYRKKKITKLAKANVALLKECKNLCADIATYATRTGIKMIDENFDDVQLLQILGEQAIYSQTIPSYYMLKTVGLKHLLSAIPFHTAIMNYEKHLQEIIKLVDTRTELTKLVKANLEHWYNLEQICTQLVVASESTEEFYPLLEASAGLTLSNQTLMARIVDLGS